MAIQNDNTILNKGDLKAYHQKILPYLGGNMMVNTNNTEYYSTDEKVVGVWLDGKPLYQKTFTGTTTSASCTIANLTSLNIDGVYGFRGAVYLSTLGWMPFNYSKTDYITGYYLKSSKTLEYRSDSAYATVPYYITLQYTKTTDTAGSATTTPGAYDINRPDLWPNGQEIFFGNGLYGMRKAETAAANNLQSGIVLVSNVSKTACCYNKGGMIDMSGTNGTNWYDINGGWDYKGNQRQFNPLITNTDQTFRFYCQDNQGYTTQNIQYNIWFTYTK